MTTITIPDLEQRADGLISQATAIQNSADTQTRDLTHEETSQVNEMLDEHDRIQTDIQRRKRLLNASDYLAQPATPPPAQRTNSVPARQAPPPPNGQRPGASAPYRVQVESRAAGSFGFRDIGEFAYAVKNASLGGNRVDPRLFNSAGPPDNVMTEGVNADGGYAVPPDFRPDIQSLIETPATILGMTDGITTSSNAVTVPVDASTPWQATGGIQAYWEAEAAQKKNSKLGLDQVTCKLNKLYVLVPVSDELLEDAPALGALLKKKAPEAIDWKITDAVLNGSGVGQPQGIYTSAATIIVPRPSTQAVKTITADNVLDMWAAMLAQSRSRAVWLTSQEIESRFPKMFIPIIDGTGAVVNGEVAYLPPGGLAGNPFGTLMGRPVIVTEAAPDPGKTGDLTFVDPKAYLSVTKVEGVRQDISIHLWFDWDITCFRFVLRVGGCPWFKQPVLSKSGAYKHSPFVALGGDGVVPTSEQSYYAEPSEQEARLASHASPLLPSGRQAPENVMTTGNTPIATPQHGRGSRS